MTFRVDDSWIPGKFIVGHQGGGVLAEDLDPLGHLFNDVTLPADAGKEICGRITYWPPGLNLIVDEDGGTSATAADGIYVAQYQLYADYVATGPATSLTYTFGEVGTVAGAAWVEGNEAFALVGAVAAPSGVVISAGWAEESEAFALAGMAAAPAITIGAAWVEGSENFAMVGTAGEPQDVAAAAAWTEGGEGFALLIEVETFFARAPAGDGYRPRSYNVGQVRPADIQGSER